MRPGVLAMEFDLVRFRIPYRRGPLGRDGISKIPDTLDHTHCGASSFRCRRSRYGGQGQHGMNLYTRRYAIGYRIVNMKVVCYGDSIMTMLTTDRLDGLER